MTRRSPSTTIVVALVVAMGLLIGGCWFVQVYFSDYRRAPVGVGILDPDPVVYLGPGDELEVGLLGHPSHPDLAWEAVSFDPEVITLSDTIHTPEAGAPPPLSELPPEIADVYRAVPESEKTYHEVEGGLRFWYVPDTRFVFAGAELGTTTVSFALAIDGDVLWAYSFPVTVVEDPCVYIDDQDAVQVPHRCG